MSEKMEFDLDPKKVLDALADMQKSVSALAEKIDASLGKEAPKSLGKLEDAAEKGTNKIAKLFGDLGNRLKEDMKTAFDVGKLFAGIKIGESIAEGTHQVLDMERAFDKLNTRLQLTSKQLQDFKTQVSNKVATTGQRLEDVLPGVETAASKGKIRSPEQLAAIAESLGQARAATGENTEGLADVVVGILRDQGQKITADSFKKTLDTLQGTRTSGAFKTAGEAGAAMKGIAGSLSAEQQQKMGLGTRELGGLAALASKSEGGQEIMKHLLATAATPGGQQMLNSIMGTQLFKGGKFQTQNLQNINSRGLGQYSESVMGEATGTNQAEMAKFISSMKEGLGDFNKVIEGSNETAQQFQTATNNLASRLDQFKESAKKAGLQIGESFAVLGNDILSGHFKSIMGDVKGVGKSSWENKGSLLAMAGLAGTGALLAGGGAKGLLKKLPGMGGLAGGLLEGEAAKAAGIQPVFVVNASEIGGGGVGKDLLGGLSGAAGKLGKFGGAASAMIGELALPATLAAGAGYAASKAAEFIGTGGLEDAARSLTGGNGKDSYTGAIPLPADSLKTAVMEGTVDAHKKIKGDQKVAYTNPSTPTGAGRKM